MFWRTWMCAAAVASFLTSSGCVSSGHKSFELAHKAGPSCDVTHTQRNQVYVFAVGGNTPANVKALDDFRKGIAAAGFPKIATGQAIHSSWMASELQEIHKDYPDAVFVLIGLETAGPVAKKLAEDAMANNVPVRALILSNAPFQSDVVLNGIRRATIGNAAEVVAASGLGSVGESRPIPQRLGIVSRDDPTATVTAEQQGDLKTIWDVVKLLNDIALQTPPPETTFVNEWSYPHAPPARPEILPGSDPDWAFLFDEPGGTTRAIGDPVPTMPEKRTYRSGTAIAK